jgi:hypothetical protein
MKNNKNEVNHPSRYGGDSVYECVKVVKAWVERLKMSPFKAFLYGSAIKYLSRLGAKDDPILEIDKSIDYLQKLRAEYVAEKSKK